MSFLDTVRAKRQKLVDVLLDEDYSGIRQIVESLYPDQAHFIYELLQNAEDVGASEAKFSLSADSLRFEHNGRPFNEDDVLAITNIGRSAKEFDPDQIGCFGVGFKAVFSYSETPRIWSPTFSFEISDLVFPTEIDSQADLGQKTRFEFPFNNPKKIASDAYIEVKEGLEKLAETTLLFLSNLKSISWETDPAISGEIMRIHHSKNHIEVLKEIGRKKTGSSHFLRFTDPVEGLNKQYVSVAFALDYLPNITEFNSEVDLAKQLRIVSANPGRVSVSFPAEKETSGLRFHLHAPFVPELSRASVKETPVNTPLFDQLARLTATALHSVRDQKLLNGEFLGVLPNSHDDNIPDRYQPIYEAVIEEMNNKRLTPTHSRLHAPARQLLKARASLKSLLSRKDLKCLVEDDVELPQWGMGATQRNSRIDRFLSDLAITEWDTYQFSETIFENTYKGSSSKGFMKWLRNKSDEWHQQMYAYLYENLADAYTDYNNAKIVRLVGSGNYEIGSSCYFPSTGVKRDKIFPRVDRRVYSSGKNKKQQENAMKFLREIGVSDVDEVDQVKAILKQRYTDDNLKPDLKDLDRFISLTENEPDQTDIFANYLILKTADGKWCKPKAVYLDTPCLETGLKAYYEALKAYYAENVVVGLKMPLSPEYANLNIPPERWETFAEVIGVQVKLDFKNQSVGHHPDKMSFWEDFWTTRKSNQEIDEDWILPNLDKVFKEPSQPLSRLVWNTMLGVEQSKLKAKYRPNRQVETRVADSSLVINLRKLSWIPQTNGEYVPPSKASRDLLPSGFAFDAGEAWLIAIRFGAEEERRSEEHVQKQTTAKEFGFRDLEELEWAISITKLFPHDADRKRLLAKIHAQTERELPEHEPRNPKKRSKRIGEDASDAPERDSEERWRRVQKNRARVKQEAEQYLREQYTSDNEMICQICKTKFPLPFKLDGGNYYFEKVDFVPDLKKLHYQNNIALCPNHSAMFQYVNRSRDSLKAMFLEIEGNELKVELAQEETTIYFTKTHVADLKDVIKSDENLTGEDEDS